MGTNYYLVGKKCPCCGLRNPDMKKHIGKSSGGVCFSLHVDNPNKEYDDKIGIRDLDGWVEAMKSPDHDIMDEYDREVSFEDMLAIITERKGKERQETPYGYSSWEAFHNVNQSEAGPDGLLRHRIDGRHCIGHGIGTWDYVCGEFS